ncbi:unnamed protein product, partial [Meganyctiphanes norvegica]
IFKKLGSICWREIHLRFLTFLIIEIKFRKTVRSVEPSTDKVIPDAVVLDQLMNLVQALSEAIPPGHPRVKPSPRLQQQQASTAQQLMQRVLGYSIVRGPSLVGGRGVNVAGSKAVCCSQLVGLYPGAIYLPYQPILLQSVGNPFIFRCADGILIDGNDKSISRMMYRSCSGRDRVGIHELADSSWLTEFPQNPLNVGQYVNNQSKGFPSNVCYHEITLEPGLIPITQRRFLPNLWYSTSEGRSVADVPLRLVALVATRDISPGEELFSDYFTIAH